jgi:hypothetical protein
MAWKKGQSGNPGGRPKGARALISVMIMEELQKQANQTDDRTKLQIMIERAVEMGMAGDLKAFDMLMDRTAGKAREIVEFTETEVEIEDLEEIDESEIESEETSSQNSEGSLQKED